MTPPPSLQELIDTVRADAASDGPLDQLAVASATVAELSETADAALGFFVDQCRRSGHSWTEISAALGVSKQAAHKRFAAGLPPLERFTARARRSLEGAVDAARALGHSHVGTEHVLIGLFDEPDGIAARLLAEAGASRERVASAVLERVPRATGGVADPPLTPRAIAAVMGAVAEAVQLGHNYVGTEHLVLALFQDREGVAAKVLADLDLSYDDLRQQVVNLLANLPSGWTTQP